MTQMLVYLDCNATMPVRPEAVAAMMRALAEPGNASSVHGYGRRARRMVEDARAAIAALVGTDPNYVTFTGGATESNNTILRTHESGGVMMCATEHPSVRECLPDAIRVPVKSDGVIDMAVLESLLVEHCPALLSVMLVNNETGVIQPVADIVRLVRRLSPDTRVHTDAVQAAGRIEIDFSALQVDYMTLSAHKMGGPQGVGALIAAPGADIQPLLRGGGQERRKRAGTENVAAIAGFGVAADIARERMDEMQALEPLRDALEARLLALEPRLKISGRWAPRVGNTMHIVLPGVAAETQLMALDLSGICVSSGSACSSGTVKPNTVLKAMGASDTEALSALRVSMGWNTTQSDLDRFSAAWETMHARVRDKVA